MPKLRPSLGEIEIKTPHSSFAKYIRDELNNLKEWNPKYMHSIGNLYIWKPYSNTELWRILITSTGIKCKSNEPIIYLRQGIKIFMGSSRIEIV